MTRDDIAAPPSPRVMDSARRIAQFRAAQLQFEAATNAIRAGQHRLAEMHHREAQRLLEASRT